MLRPKGGPKTTQNYFYTYSHCETVTDVTREIKLFFTNVLFVYYLHHLNYGTPGRFNFKKVLFLC